MPGPAQRGQGTSKPKAGAPPAGKGSSSRDSKDTERPQNTQAQKGKAEMPGLSAATLCSSQKLGTENVQLFKV